MEKKYLIKELWKNKLSNYSINSGIKRVFIRELYKKCINAIKIH